MAVKKSKTTKTQKNLYKIKYQNALQIQLYIELKNVENNQ